MNLLLFLLYLLALFGIWTWLLGGLVLAGGSVGSVLVIGLGVLVREQLQARRRQPRR